MVMLLILKIPMLIQLVIVIAASVGVRLVVFLINGKVKRTKNSRGRS